MITGFDTAFSEITLVLFTTLAPSGVVAYLCMALPVLARSTDAAMRQRLNVFLAAPLIVSMAGLVASATHLGNPANALYVFVGVGRSPLSTEVFCAVLFLALAGLYWLYCFAEHPRPLLQRLWLMAAMAAGVGFVIAVAFAYAAETIVSWRTVYVPLNLVLNSLVGGPVLAIAGLCAAGYGGVRGRWGRVLVAAAAAALALNVGGFALQGAELPLIDNSFTTAADLVPGFGAMVGVFAAAGALAVGLDAFALWGCSRLSVPGALAAAGSALVGIFVMRFAFYMMHMTVGISI